MVDYRPLILSVLMEYEKMDESWLWETKKMKSIVPANYQLPERSITKMKLISDFPTGKKGNDENKKPMDENKGGGWLFGYPWCSIDFSRTRLIETAIRFGPQAALESESPHPCGGVRGGSDLARKDARRPTTPTCFGPNLLWCVIET